MFQIFSDPCLSRPALEGSSKQAGLVLPWEFSAQCPDQSAGSRDDPCAHPMQAMQASWVPPEAAAAAAAAADQSSSWSCPACTLINAPHTTRCEACHKNRPPKASQPAPQVSLLTLRLCAMQQMPQSCRDLHFLYSFHSSDLLKSAGACVKRVVLCALLVLGE